MILARRHGLHGCDLHARVDARHVGHDDRGDARGRQALRGVHDDLAAVDDEEHPMPAVDGPRDELRRDGGFPEAGWRDEEHTPRTSERRPDLADRARLVRRRCITDAPDARGEGVAQPRAPRSAAVRCIAVTARPPRRGRRIPTDALATRAGAGKADDGGEAEERHRNHSASLVELIDGPRSNSVGVARF